MPIYEYACSNCGKLNEVLQKVSDPAPEKCDGCGAEKSLSKIVSRSSFVLKGGGWYSDLYSSASGKKGDKKTDTTAAPSSTPPTSTSTPSTSSAGSTSGSGGSGSGGSGGSGPKMAAAAHD